MTDSTLKNTPLTELHMREGAKMGAFAGYSMPLFYPLGLMKEHLHTRASAGLFDISHMVHIEISGREASKLIERLCPYQASSQETGTCRYTFFLTESAGIIDDLIITRLDEARFLIVANAGCAEKDVAHVKAISESFDVSVNIIPRGFIALQGPAAEAVLEQAGLPVSDMAFMTAIETANGWFVSRTGYTGEDGFEVGMPIDETESFTASLITDDRVELIGLGARDSLRLEAGLPLYGQDLSDEISPHEAGLIWSIPKPLREGGSYIGADALAKKISAGRERMRIGLKPREKIPVRSGALLVDDQGNQTGHITSGGFGPSADYPVAMGLISVTAADQPIFADVRGRKIEMKRVKPPFIPHSYKR